MDPSEKKEKEKKIMAIQQLNNFVKSILLELYAPRELEGGILVDLACGRGQDFGKYPFYHPRLVLAIDSDEPSLREAEHRWNSNDRARFDLVLSKQDLRTLDIIGNHPIGVWCTKGKERKEKKTFRNQCHWISCHFAVHYLYQKHNPPLTVNGFSDVVEHFLNEIDDLLHSSGICAMIVPDGKAITRTGSFQNEYCQVTVHKNTCTFLTQGAYSSWEEPMVYLEEDWVPWLQKTFYLLVNESVDTFLERALLDIKWEKLRTQMKIHVVSLTPSQKKILCLYRIFVFQKCNPS